MTIPVGSHEFTNAVVSYAIGAQRRASGTLSLQAGNCYNGTLTSVGYFAARVSVLKQFSFEPTMSINRATSPARASPRGRTAHAPTTASRRWMFTSALLQYISNGRAFSGNLRFRWEYRPGSELFVVYTDERDMTNPRFALPTQVLGLENRVATSSRPRTRPRALRAGD